MGKRVGTVAMLARYPIKSMAGEALDRADIETRGIATDRLWAVENALGKFGSGKTTRRFQKMNGLLRYRSRVVESEVLVTCPDGHERLASCRSAEAELSNRMGVPVKITTERDVAHHDEAGLHLISSSALSLLERVIGEPVDIRRFRANILLATDEAGGQPELEWIGKAIRFASGVEIQVTHLMPRCVMVNLAQHELDADPRILKAISAINTDVSFGVAARVLTPGAIALGETASL